MTRVTVATMAFAFVLASQLRIAAQEQVPADPAAPPSTSPLVTDAETDAAGGDETPELWYVELASPPTADGTPLVTVRQEKAAFRAAARRAGLSYEERLAFDVLWNGLSVRIDRADVSRLARIQGVRAIYPVPLVAAPEPLEAAEEIEPELFSAIAQTGADRAQNELGLTGAGVRVGIIDSGIDYHHPDLGGCFGPGCRVEKGWDFVGNTYPTTAAMPDADPDDCGGHGTHVSGIVGARPAGPSGVKGVAPGVILHAYKVFGCSGATSGDYIMAAKERALADGAQVVNLSLGAANAWPVGPNAQATSRLVNRGVVVVGSAGNSGGATAYNLSSEGVYPKAIGAASFDNSHVRLPFFTVTPDETKIGYNTSNSPAPPVSGSFTLARTGTVTSTIDACNAVAPAPGSLSGQVALIRRGGCGFYDKVINAERAGAVAVVIYNNSAGRVGMSVAPPAGQPAVAIPAVSVSDDEGALLNSRLASGPVTMTWTNLRGSFFNPSGGLLSGFTSTGLSPDLDLKPDVGAPGGSIYSTLPLEQGSYGMASGTSMSSPHTAGTVALLLEAHPHTPANAVRTILQNSADPRPSTAARTSATHDLVHRQGAGMVDIDQAIQATTRIEPGKLPLGDSDGGSITRQLTILNSGGGPVTYDLAHEPAFATQGTAYAPATVNAAAAVAFSVASVTVEPGVPAVVDVTITPPAGLAERGQFGGYVAVRPQGGGEGYRVPYAGIKGDYQAIPVLTTGGGSFPWLARRTGTSYVKQSAGAVFTVTGGDNAYALLHLDHHSRRLLIEVKDAATGTSLGRVVHLRYLSRNAAANSFFAFAFDGNATTGGGKTVVVPDGEYQLAVTVEKAGSDGVTPGHFETWTSPAFLIDRP